MKHFHKIIAGLDVYENDLGVHQGSLGSNIVLLLPHIGSATFNTRKLMGTLSATNIIDVLEGRVPRH